MLLKYRKFINEIKINQNNGISEISKEQLEKNIGFDGNSDEILRLKSLLRILPEYNNITINFKSNKGGLGYVNSKEYIKDRILTTIEFNGLPSPEVYVHELYHYFTLPALVRPDTPISFEYISNMQYLYEYSKNRGYSVINGISIHDTLNEFCVNITNHKSYNDLLKIGIYDKYLEVTLKFFNSLKLIF